MDADVNAAALQHEELVALVQQLRQQVAERDRQIEDLKRQLAEVRQTSIPKESDCSPEETVAFEQQNPTPGSQEDLLARLEQIYPGEK